MLSSPVKVSKITGNNMVARAVAAKRLASVMLTMQIRLYMIVEPEWMFHEVQDISRYLTLSILGCQADRKFHAEVKEIDSVLADLVRISDQGHIVGREDVRNICDAMDLAAQVVNDLTPYAVNKAQKSLKDMYAESH